MATLLNQIRDNKGARHRRKVVGRGIGSGKGKTCGLGHKGQKARSGVSIKGFEGGQMPIYRRLPKRGFFNDRREEYQSVNLGRIQDFIDRNKLDAKKTITAQALLEARVVKNLNTPIKLLAKGEVKSKLTIEVAAASAGAIALVEKAGGKVTIAKQIKAAPGPKKEKTEKTA